MINTYPICVDLDGTLIEEDVSWLSFKVFIKKNLLNIFLSLFWLVKGRAYLKLKLSQYVPLPFEILTFNLCLIEKLKEAHKGGAQLVLATGATQHYAQYISDYLGCFDDVFGSEDKINLTGKNKRQRLVNTFGLYHFYYIGNSAADLKVWPYSAGGLCVNAPQSVRKRYLQLNLDEIALSEVWDVRPDI